MLQRSNWRYKNITKILDPTAPPEERAHQYMKMASRWNERYHWRNARKCSLKAVEMFDKHKLDKHSIFYAEANLQLGYVYLSHAAWGKARKPLDIARQICEKHNFHIMLSKIFMAYSDLYHMKKRGKTAGQDHDEAKKFRFMADEEERKAEVEWADEQRKSTEKLIAAGLMPKIPVYREPSAPTPGGASFGQNLAHMVNPSVPVPSFFQSSLQSPAMSLANIMGATPPMAGGEPQPLMPSPSMAGPSFGIAPGAAVPNLLPIPAHQQGAGGALIAGGQMGMGLKTPGAPDSKSALPASEPPPPWARYDQ